MRIQLTVSLSLALGVFSVAHAQEGGREIIASTQALGGESVSSAVSLGRPMPAALGRPEPAMEGTDAHPLRPDSQLRSVSYEPAPIVRGQSPDFGAPALPAPAPIGPGAPPAAGNERYNCGVVTDPPAGPSNGFLRGCQNFLSGCNDKISGVFGNKGGRPLFQSDHAFDGFTSFTSNPLLAEDPRSLTEIRPIFMWQGAPLSNSIFHGSDIEYFGVQGRVAFTDRISLVVSELGGIWSEVHNAGDGFTNGAGFAEVRIGPKYTFYRCEDTQTVAAVGLNFDIPTGSNKVFQNTGSLSLEPYVSVAQNFGRTSFGSFNVMDTLGYSAATDNQRSDFLFDSLHLDFDILNAHRYPRSP